MEYTGDPERIVLSGDAALFNERHLDVAKILQNSFAGAPWFEDLSDAEALSRVDSHAQKPGFDAVLALEKDTVVAGLWYDEPSLEELRDERGEQLANFAQFMSAYDDITRIVWEREVVVSPDHQGKGLATKLRESFLDRLRADNEGATLLLTRMRDDNGAIIAIAEKLGYARTGIRMPSSQTPDFSHEYWYRVVDSRE